ncbi:MAG: hypothetical protein RBU45_17630 [Myxococcota bacterium]|nr:hypothetical protein [Myxococcota bacterium]
MTRRGRRLLPLLVCLPAVGGCIEVFEGQRGADLDAAGPCPAAGCPDAGAGERQDGGLRQDACPDAGCLAAAGEACRWDLDCRAPLVCEDRICRHRAPPADGGRPRDGGEPPDGGGGDHDEGTIEPADSGTSEAELRPTPDSGGPAGCIDPREGCPLVCGTPACTHTCGDLDGDQLVTHCDAALLPLLPRLDLCQQIYGDVDLSGGVDGEDARLIRDYATSGNPALLRCGELPP